MLDKPLMNYMPLRVFILIASFSMSAFAQGAPAPAAKTDKVEELSIEGMNFYQNKRYDAAIERFQQAYAIYADPVLLYNIARAYQAIGDTGKAKDYLKRCVRDPATTKDVLTRAQLKLDMLEKAEKEASLNPETKATPIKDPDPSNGSTSTQPGVSGKARSSSTPMSVWILGGAALVAGGVGGYFLMDGLGQHSDLDDAKAEGQGGATSSMTQKEAQDLSEGGSQSKTIGAVLLSVASVAAISAVSISLLSGGSDDAPKADVSLSPSQDGGFLMLRGSF